MPRKVAFALISALLVLSTVFIFVPNVQAEESIPKPSVPEFTVQFVAQPYNVPTKTITTIEPYTGEKTVTTQPGYHLENKSIQLIIKTQPFTPFQTQDSANWSVNFYYNIRYKGHFSEEWQYCYSPADGYLPQGSGIDLGNGYFVYTFYRTVSLEPNTQIDFQVEAIIGYTHRVVEGGMAPWRFTGETSGWSNTQTLTINESETTPTPTNSNEETIAIPTESENIQTGKVQQVSHKVVLFGIEWKDLAITLLTAVVTVLVLMTILHRKKHVKNYI